FPALCFGAKCKLLEPFYFDKDNELTISDGNESVKIRNKKKSNSALIVGTEDFHAISNSARSYEISDRALKNFIRLQASKY
ncbi:hypothetical protein BpHYR1_023605, partial [Brachionus plicatilis]